MGGAAPAGVGVMDMRLLRYVTAPSQIRIRHRTKNEENIAEIEESTQEIQNTNPQGLGGRINRHGAHTGPIGVTSKAIQLARSSNHAEPSAGTRTRTGRHISAVGPRPPISTSAVKFSWVKSPQVCTDSCCTAKPPE